MTKPKKAKTVRRPSQIAAEQAREEAGYGKTTIRHTAESRAAMNRVMDRLDTTGPDAMRQALLYFDKRGNR